MTIWTTLFLLLWLCIIIIPLYNFELFGNTSTRILKYYFLNLIKHLYFFFNNKIIL
jgi:hypothetical protein